MSDYDILPALASVVDAFERLGVPYRIAGSVASSIYGAARATIDVDLVADLRLEHVEPLLISLQGAYYISEEAVREALARRTSFNAIHLETMVKVDVFVLKSGEYDREAFQRMHRDTVEESEGAREFSFATPEDVILNKLDWYRQGGCVSERQWGDVLGVMRVQGTALDRAYLRHWAAVLNLLDLLERAFGEAGLE